MKTIKMSVLKRMICDSKAYNITGLQIGLVKVAFFKKGKERIEIVNII